MYKYYAKLSDNTIHYLGEFENHSLAVKASKTYIPENKLILYISPLDKFKEDFEQTKSLFSTELINMNKYYIYTFNGYRLIGSFHSYFEAKDCVINTFGREYHNLNILPQSSINKLYLDAKKVLEID